MSEQPLSLWFDTLADQPVRRAPLAGDTESDVAIVGGGFTGLWTAYHLLRERPGLRVVVVEAQTVGFGASGRNGGWCSALFPLGWDALVRRSGGGAAGAAAARAMTDALRATVDDVGRTVTDEGIDAQYVKGGTVSLARNPAQLARAAAAVAASRERGDGPGDHALLDATEAAARVGATRVLGATYTPHCARVHPGRLVRGLADAVERRGGTIVEDTRATAIEPGAVRTVRGSVLAPLVVRATEGYTPELPGLRRELVPVYSLVLATEPIPDPVWDVIGLREHETFADHRHLIVYGQRTADGRIVFGGRGAPYHYGSAVRPSYDREPGVFEALRSTLVDLFPVLHDVAITHRWGGPLGIPRDWHPSVGFDPSTGTAHAGGYVGDGVAASYLAGRTLADLLLGRDTPRTRLPWVGHRSQRWEPEPLRWIGINAALRLTSSADEVEERTGRPARRTVLTDRLLGG